MIRTILLDIGKVLIDYDWKSYLLELCGNEKAAAVVADAAFGHEIWVEMDRGVWTDEKILAEMMKFAGGYERELQLFFDRMGGVLHQQPHAKTWIRELKAAGYQVLYLSNWSQHLWDQSGENMDFIPLTDGGIFSWKERMVKPDVEIYHRIAEVYQLDLSECVFIDDTEANCKGAEKAGLLTIRFVNGEKTWKELTDLLKKDGAFGFERA